MRSSRVCSLALVAIIAPALPAQVGHLPTKSPYRDLEFRQELNWFGGWFNAQRDPAAVAPKPGPMAGMRYEVYLAGPAHLHARVAGISSERTRLSPTAANNARVLGTNKVALLQADVGLTANLTGQRSIYHLVPYISTGLGIVSDLGRKEDEGGYKFGTPFAFALGGGLRFAPGGRFQLRLDYTDHLYHVRYPDAYFLSTSGNTPLITDTRKRSVWTNNSGISLGASYFFYR